MKQIAHRGFSDRQPENTLRAIREVATHADLIEIDVRRCETGELVVIHHRIITPISATAGRVSELTAAELANLDIHDSGEGVPTLEAALDAAPTEVGIDIELKETGIAADVIKAVDAIKNDVLLSSMKVDILREIRQIDPTIPLAYITNVKPEKNVETAVELDCVAICPHRNLCFATDVVERAHEAGLEAYAWPVESRLQAQALEAAGVDGIIATSPAVFEDFSRARKAAYRSLLRACRTLGCDFEDVYFGARVGAFLICSLLVGGLLAVGWRDRYRLVESIVNRDDL